jgi:hypothetical protein
MRKLSTRYCTLFDLGRTGMLFACEHLWLEPDVMCVSKPITGGYGGLGAVITTAGIAVARVSTRPPNFRFGSKAAISRPEEITARQGTRSRMPKAACFVAPITGTKALTKRVQSIELDEAAKKIWSGRRRKSCSIGGE